MMNTIEIKKTIRIAFVVLASLSRVILWCLEGILADIVWGDWVDLGFLNGIWEGLV